MGSIHVSEENDVEKDEQSVMSPVDQAISNLRCPSPLPILQGVTSNQSITSQGPSVISPADDAASTHRRETIPAGGAILQQLASTESLLSMDSQPVSPPLVSSHQLPSDPGDAETVASVGMSPVSSDGSPGILPPGAVAQSVWSKLSSGLERDKHSVSAPPPETGSIDLNRSGSLSAQPKPTSIHAHFFLDETVGHSGTRSRSSSIGNTVVPKVASGPAVAKRVTGVQSAGDSASATTAGGNSSANTVSSAATGIPKRLSVMNSKGEVGSNVDPRLPEDDGKIHILFGACGSISTLKLKLIIQKLEQIYGASKISIQLILTSCAERFLAKSEFPADVRIWRDEDEWKTWTSRTDPVLHIELRRWADILIIAPLTANTLGKIALGLCDNLLTNVIRAWNPQYPIIVAPSMVIHSYNSPVTKRHLKTIAEEMKWIEVLKPVEKVVDSYGDIGMGGMMDWNEIVDKVVHKLGGYPEDEDDDEDDEDDDDTRPNDADDDDDDDDEEDDDTEIQGDTVFEPDIEPTPRS